MFIYRYPVPVLTTALLAASVLSQVSAIALPRDTMSGIFNTLPSQLDEVDVIIVGGGTTGCVVAAKISDENPDLKVLVVERGQDNYQDPTVTNPLYFMQNILDTGTPSPRMMSYNATVPEPQVGNRTMVVPAGSVLGGGSSINMLTYTRGQRQDLEWNMPGWSADELLPYMNRAETYHGPGNPADHGSSGPIQVSDGGFGLPAFQDDFIAAAAKVGIRESVDLQALDDNNAVQRNLRYISPDGIRSDAAHAYLHPRLRDGAHPNLQVLVEHEVIRILTENGKAVGIETRPNPTFAQESAVSTIRAKHMVIASAGNLGTPLLLERSGIGRPEILQRAGIDVVAELPGVGEALQDHNTILLSYFTHQPDNETYDVLLKGEATLEQFVAENNPMLAWNSAEMTSKIRPSEQEIEALGLSEAALALWDRDFRSDPNRPVATSSTAGGFIAQIPESLSNWTILSTGNFLLHPYARGYVHVTAPEVDAPIDLFTGILTDEAGFDRAMTMWLYKKTREIIRRLDVYRGEFPALHPPFAEDSAAAIRTYDAPLGKDIDDIAYTPEDDQVLSDWVTLSLSQNWHSLGTCKMAPRERGGVVDESLGVYGVKNLKIADLSVVPVNQAANTVNIAYAIGERGGEALAKELKCRH